MPGSERGKSEKSRAGVGEGEGNLPFKSPKVTAARGGLGLQQPGEVASSAAVSDQITESPPPHVWKTGSSMAHPGFTRL